MFADDSACVALTDMPPRSEHELDPVTLHNQALMNIEQNPTEGFEKLQFLLKQNPFPPETFPNLLLLYVKYEVCDVSVEKCCLLLKRLNNDLFSLFFRLPSMVVRRQEWHSACRKILLQ